MTNPEFQKFPKIARFSRECIITEKIDGTNAQIRIEQDGTFLTGSRTRWITPENDNFGFSRWAHDNNSLAGPELWRLRKAVGMTLSQKAPFPAFGGKRSIANEVWKRFGRPRQYIEPFCFSAAVLLAASICAELRGKDLACWCPLDQPCHVDILLEIANA